MYAFNSGVRKYMVLAQRRPDLTMKQKEMMHTVKVRVELFIGDFQCCPGMVFLRINEV